MIQIDHINHNQKDFLTTANKERLKTRSTTVVCVRRKKEVAMAADGQVSLGQTIIKSTAKKIKILADGNVLAGIAGGTADAITLIERLEGQLEKHSKQLRRSAIELAKAWRTDKYLRRLEAMVLVADKDSTYLISGNGDLLQSEEGAQAIGSGGNFAYACAIALLENTDLSAKEIAQRSLKIAAKICVYTNDSITLETLK